MGFPVVEGGNRHGLFEQWNAGFLPELVPEQVGGVGAERDHGRRKNMGGIVETYGVAAFKLEVDLQ